MDEACFLDGFDIDIDEARIWRWLGSHGRKGDERLVGQVEEARRVVTELAEPKAVYRWVGVRFIDPSGVALENGCRLNGDAGPKLAQLAEGAEQIVAMVSTIGPRAEERVNELFAQSRPLEAVVLDAAASAAASAASSFVQSHLCQEAAARGLFPGRTLRPGSHYWDITAQRIIFGMLPTAQIGVQLTSSCLILPRKSSSGIVPVGRRLSVQREPSEHHCRDCPNLKCIARIEPARPGRPNTMA